MILKWQDSAGHWRFIDNVMNITIVGNLSSEEAGNYVRSLNGKDAYPVWQVNYNTWDSNFKYPLVGALINNEYEFMVLDSKPSMAFIMSDEGKTVDRF